MVTSDNPLAADPKWSKPRLLLSSSSGGGIPKASTNAHVCFLHLIPAGETGCIDFPVQVICNRLAVLSSGEWLLPYWREQTPGAVEDGTCKVHEKGEVEARTRAASAEHWPPSACSHNSEAIALSRVQTPGGDHCRRAACEQDKADATW